MLLVLGSALLFQNHYPRFTGAPSGHFRTLSPTPTFGGFGLKGRVVEKRKDYGQALVELELWEGNQRRETAIRGGATVVLLSRN